MIIAKHQNTFAKRQREVEKKRKQDEKRVRRNNKPEGTDAPVTHPMNPGDISLPTDIPL